MPSKHSKMLSAIIYISITNHNNDINLLLEQLSTTWKAKFILGVSIFMHCLCL